MNWGRAKNLLLVVFVILNLLLGYFNFALPLWFLPAQAVDDDDLRVTRDALEKANIFLLQPIPRTAPQMGYLPVRRSQADPGVVAARFFADQQVKAERQEGGDGQTSYEFSSGDERLDISPNGILTYRNDAIQVADSAPQITATEAKAVAEEFISKRLGGLPKSAKLGLADTNSGPASSQHVIYYQTYQGFLIYDAYIDVVVTAQGVTLLNQRWVDPIGWPAEGATVASASDILLRLPQDPRFRQTRDFLTQGQADAQIVVKEISLGYYTALQPEQEMKAFPVWRILLAQGDEFYFNALTGVREYPQ